MCCTRTARSKLMFFKNRRRVNTRLTTVGLKIHRLVDNRELRRI